MNASSREGLMLRASLAWMTVGYIAGAVDPTTWWGFVLIVIGAPVALGIGMLAVAKLAHPPKRPSLAQQLESSCDTVLDTVDQHLKEQ